MMLSGATAPVPMATALWDLSLWLSAKVSGVELGVDAAVEEICVAGWILNVIVKLVRV